MTESIWGKVTPTGYSTGQNSFNTQLYTIFSVSEDTTLAGISFYSNPAATKLPIATGIFAVGNTTPLYTNTSPTWDGAAGSGWITTTNETAISLSASTDYIVCVVGPGDAAGNSWLCFITPSAFPITNGAVTAPASSGALTNSPYIDGGANSTPIYPTSSTDIKWFVDVQLNPASSGVTGTADVTLKKMTVSGSGGPKITGTGAVTLKKMSVSGSSSLVGTGAVTLKKMTVSGSATAPLVGACAVTLKKMTVSGSGSVSSEFSVVFDSTDGNGIDTYDVTSTLNGTGAKHIRVLAPDAPDTSYPHSFLYVLPVEADQGSVFGDPMSIAVSLNIPNTYNLTVIQPGFDIDPWYADNADDSTISQETFMLDVVSWAEANLATTGSEFNYLIGFSKSGTGGQQLILRNPGIFRACASWDFPADMATYDRFSGESDVVFGDQTNFANNYELSSANLDTWKTSFLSNNRLWLGGFSLYGTEVDDYDARLTAKGIQHTYTYKTNEAHSWNEDWVSNALATIISPSGTTGTGNVSLKKMTVSGSGTVKLFASGAVTLKKMTVSGVGTAPLVGTGAVTLKKMTISGSGRAPLVGIGAITFKKMQVHGVAGQQASTVSELFIFSPL